jgi:hypothetical protein
MPGASGWVLIALGLVEYCFVDGLGQAAFPMYALL